MNIRWEQPTEPPRVRYGDLERGSLYCIHVNGRPWLKGDDNDVVLDYGSVVPSEHPDTLVLPLDAELVIRGYAGERDMSADALADRDALVVDLRNTLRLLRGKRDALRRERDVLLGFVQGLQSAGTLESAKSRARMAVDEADRIRCEAERGDATGAWFDRALDALIQKAARSMPPHDFVFHVSSHISDARIDIAMSREAERGEGDA